MPTDQLHLSVDCDRRLAAVEVSSQRTLEWTVEVPKVAQARDRAPVNLALVLDRSGSMRGDKLRYVQDAARYVLDTLEQRDRAAVVAYDDQVTTVAPSTHVTPERRGEMQERVRALRPGGQTDLGGGWLRGCDEVAAHQNHDSLNRVLLLTDGLANKGITDLEELGHHARELRKRGVSTSTFGVGLDFNEHLLEAIAEEGGGNFHYIQRPEEIPGVFRGELGELLTVVAREAFLSISLPKGVSVEVVGDLLHERDGDRLRIFLGDLTAGERRTIYTRVLLPPDAPGTALVLRGGLGYADLDGRPVTATAEQWFSYARQVELEALPVHQALLSRVGEVEIAAAASRALKLERRGEYAQAQQLMVHAVALSAPHLHESQAAAYNSLADDLGRGLSAEQRKQTHFEAYRKRKGRG